VRISVQDIERVAEVIRLHKVKNVWFYNWGEPFLSPTIGEELAVVRDLNPDLTITISTNGLLLDSDKKRETALLVDHVMFSIFGSTQESLTRYQRGGNFERSWSNMRELVRYRDLRHRTRPKIEWKYVLFRWNDSHELILRATELAKRAGIDVLSFRVTALPGTGISYRFFLSNRLQELMKESPGKPRIEWHGDATSSDSS
jgi:wyosine [tRNA(Phe)-imidazoG37] synthetase (radical SAM superfamily)